MSGLVATWVSLSSSSRLDPPPAEEDVVAGWTAFGIWLGLVAVVALLGYFLLKQLRRADDARRRGVFGDPPETDETADEAGETEAAEGTGTPATDPGQAEDPRST